MREGVSMGERLQKGITWKGREGERRGAVLNASEKKRNEKMEKGR